MGIERGGPPRPYLITHTDADTIILKETAVVTDLWSAIDIAKAEAPPGTAYVLIDEPEDQDHG